MNIISRLSATALLAVLLLGACTQKDKDPYANTDIIDPMPTVKGDSTLYGLACDGCTDSVIVFLRNSGGDPDTFDIINARQNRQVLGRPRIGDRLAVMLTPEDTTEARMVIDMDDLQGKWCYIAIPKMRDFASMPKRLQHRMMTNMPDSMKDKLLVPKEFGFQLRRSFVAQPIGMVYRSNTTDDQSPVEYPPLKMYSEWRIFNGHLILTEEKHAIPGKSKAQKLNDTADIIMLRPDTLVLRFKDGEKGYFKKN